MTNPNLEPNDSTCTDCAYMHRDREGAKWCSSPQMLAYLGHSLRCVWERDGVRDSDRKTEKCGPNGVNWRKREAY